ncbi:unnamed protein product [Protopolystoma xenopodis]|uniref:Uncharacterized protein n=1 Tax=Protopolystoma xenopodis TaxID=117903 RepID=A0A3S5AZ66_9PLAT|nr:unnamed protein product [Protopolystoma xenopodis]
MQMQQHSGPGLSVPGSNMILRWPTSLLSSQTQGQQQHAMALSQHHQTGQGHCLLGSSSNTVSVSSNPGQGNLVLTPGGGLTLSMGLRPQVPSSQMHHAPPF